VKGLAELASFSRHGGLEMRIEALSRLLQHCNIAMVFVFLIGNGLSRTVDPVNVFVSGFFDFPVYPLYPFLLVMTLANMTMGQILRTRKADVIQGAGDFSSHFIVFYVFLGLQILLVVFSIDYVATLKNTITYFLALAWGYSLLFIIGNRHEEFNKLIIKYWIYGGIAIGILSTLLYSIDYTPASSDLTAVVFHVDSIFPGFPAMRGAIDGIDTSTFISIAVFLFVVSTQKRCLRYLVLITGTLLILLMMKRTGLLMLAAGGVLYCMFAMIERKYTVIAILLILFLGMAIGLSDFLTPLITAGETQYSPYTSSRAHVFVAIDDVLDNHPLIGYGLAATEDIVNRYTGGVSQSDNAFVTLLVGTGLLGMAIYTSWVVLLWKHLFRKVASRTENELLSKSNLIVFSIILAASLTGDWINNVSVGFPFVVLLVVSSMRIPCSSRRELAVRQV
jgi:hypothetical protein